VRRPEPFRDLLGAATRDDREEPVARAERGERLAHADRGLGVFGARDDLGQGAVEIQDDPARPRTLAQGAEVTQR
jgi:hypothetical protein